MTEHEKELVRKLYDLQLQLFDIQGDEFAALEQANTSLKRSHEVIGEMLKVTGELVRPS